VKVGQFGRAKEKISPVQFRNSVPGSHRQVEDRVISDFGRFYESDSRKYSP